MILKATNYVSSAGGVFEEMFVQEKKFSIEKGRKYLLIEFEMYYFKDGEKTIHSERSIAFYGMTGDESSSNRTAIISIPNPDYDAMVAAIPETVQVPAQPEFVLIDDVETPNPDYDAEDLVTIPNPDYENMVNSVARHNSIPLLQYLYTHEGNLPEEFEVLDWGYPNFEDALSYFSGGDRSNLDISITNPFARDWFRNTLVMDNQKITQFNFVD